MTDPQDMEAARDAIPWLENEDDLRGIAAAIRALKTDSEGSTT